MSEVLVLKGDVAHLANMEYYSLYKDGRREDREEMDGIYSHHTEVSVFRPACSASLLSLP